MSKMALLFFIFTFQLLLLSTNGSDKNKTKEETKMDNENNAKTVVIFVPPANQSLYNSGGDTEVVEDVVDAITLPGELQAGVANECLCNEGLESFGHESQHAYNMNFGTINVPCENTTLDACESTSQTTDDRRKLTNDDISEEDLLQTAEHAADMITFDSIAHQDRQTNLHESSFVSMPILNDDEAVRTDEASRLDSSIADASLSDLRSSAYQQLGAALENINTYDGQDTWWNYLILNHDELDISRREQRNIERSRRPGLEFLDLLDENGFTLRQLEKMCMRFKVHEALHVLWSQKWPHVKSRRSNDKERDKSDVEVPENNSVNEEATAQTKLEENYTAENQNHLLDQGANAEQDSMDENNSVNQERDAATDAGNGETEKSAYDKTQSSDANHCTINPCKNGGTCLPSDKGYTCKCANKWYTGKDCDKDEGPCSSACHKIGTSSCYYYGSDYQYTACNCKVGYDGDQCETEHDYYKFPPFRTIVDSCNERGLSDNECIADTLDVGKIVNVVGNIFRGDETDVEKVVDKFKKMFN